jgi:hypothetical protein
MSDQEKPWAKHMGHVQDAIQRLVENPPLRRSDDPAKRWPETEKANLVGPRAVLALRELACRKTGMTMEQLLEAEAKVNHGCSPIVRQDTPGLAKSRMKIAKVPDRYVQCVADRRPIECKALEYVKDFLSSKKNFLMLTGGKGVYKSGSAAWALGQVDGGAFVHAYDLVQISIEEKEQWRRILRAPIVVLDDIGREKHDGSFGAFIDAFQKIFNGAYSDCRRLILTGNVSKLQFGLEPDKFGYGSREYDRMKEAGDWCGVAGESARGTPQLEAHWADQSSYEEERDDDEP